MRVYDQRLLARGSSVDLAIERLELSVDGALLANISLTGEASAVLADLLQHITIIELVGALADIYFSIDGRRLRPQPILDGLLLAKLGEGHRLRIHHIVSEARLLLVDDVAPLLAANWLPIVSVPTLLDLVRLLRHLPRDHVDLVVLVYQRAGLVDAAGGSVEAVGCSLGLLHPAVVKLRTDYSFNYLLVYVLLSDLLLCLIVHWSIEFN